MGMPPKKEKSSALKRARNSAGEPAQGPKKPRRSQRISSQSNGNDLPSPQDPPHTQGHLPSPVTKGSNATEEMKEGTASPPEGRPSQIRHRTPPQSQAAEHVTATGLTSPPSDTQPFSQPAPPPKAFSTEVNDEEAEGVWGYLIPLDHTFGDTLVLRRRDACPAPNSHRLRPSDGRQSVSKKAYEQQEEDYEETKVSGIASGGYLIGRHPECDRIVDVPTVSNRHCLLFCENKGGDAVAILEDLSGNGTFVNEAYVGRNKRRELQENDEVAILDEARFVFRYPRTRMSNGFGQRYEIQEQLGKGHFATVYLCVEKNSGMKYAVKKFERRTGPQGRSQVEGLQQEIGVLMGVSHPNVLCLKDAFDETDGVYLVLELATEGELFNWIVMKSKLSEAETRRLFIQLFQGIKYLHERNIVHRDIKPENILLVDKDLSTKLADFGLAKIIGEESFTTTLCGTPSYVAPEILESSNYRRYTRAVDVWSLGVVLYICLCGFPPFSDELYSAENPYTLSQQIKLGRFDYPSPYWDPVSDLALDLIDKMLTVDVEKRISIDECLEHPWTTQGNVDANDSTDGLTGAMGDLDFSKRKPHRERTMLSSINDIQVSRIVDIESDRPLKVYEKREKNGTGHTLNEEQKTMAVHRDPKEFMQLGGAKDQALFDEDSASRHEPKTAVDSNDAK